jgi:hypothetical protein
MALNHCTLWIPLDFSFDVSCYFDLVYMLQYNNTLEITCLA